MREGIPSSIDSSSWLRRVGPLAQAVEVLQQGVEATRSGTRMQVDAADLLDQLLQRLQLLQAQQQRVVLHQPSRVEQGPRRRRLLLTLDKVGLGRPLRLHDLVQQLANVARQDHVLDADLTVRPTAQNACRPNGRRSVSLPSTNSRPASSASTWPYTTIGERAGSSLSRWRLATRTSVVASIRSTSA